MVWRPEGQMRVAGTTRTRSQPGTPVRAGLATHPSFHSAVKRRAEPPYPHRPLRW